MGRHRGGWLLAAGVIGLVAAPDGARAQAAGSAGGEAPLPTVALPAPLDSVLRAYEGAWGRRDAAALAALFTDDGFVLRPGYPPVRGRDAIEQAYAQSGGPLALVAYGFAVADTVGWIVGGYGAFPDRPPTGKFVLALRKGPSGAWRIAADMDNGN